MRKIISFMHISLDGFVAGPKGEMNWIKVDEPLFDYLGLRIGQTDLAMYGRVTHQMMDGYWTNAWKKPDASKHDREHAKWYQDVQKVVLSNTLTSSDEGKVKIINNHIVSQINDIKQQPGSDILLFGSPSATHSLMEMNLIDGYWLFVNPIVLGEGIPLFKNIQHKINLKLLNTRKFNNEVVELDYIVDRGE